MRPGRIVLVDVSCIAPLYVVNPVWMEIKVMTYPIRAMKILNANLAVRFSRDP